MLSFGLTVNNGRFFSCEEIEPHLLLKTNNSADNPASDKC